MPVQIRPNRIDLNDRFPMLAFTLQSSDGPRIADVVLVTQLALLSERGARTSGNFYSSREHGILSIPASGSVFTVPPQVLARFIGAEKLYVGLATASAPGGQDWRVDVTPSESSAYVSLRGLTDRALRRVRMFPAQARTRNGPAPALLTWTGDTLAAAAPAAAPQPPAAAGAAPSTPPPAVAVPYNDGFGPLPPLHSAAATPAAPTPPVPGPAAAASPATGQAMATAMAAGDVTVGSERQAIALPSAEPMGQRRSTAIQALLRATNPVLAPVILGLRVAVEASGLSVGVGPSVSAGLGGGAALGCGLIFAPGNVMGIYGSGEIDAGWIASIGAQMQLTIVRGGIDAFNGVGYCAGISGGEGIGGGAAALFDANRNFSGVTLSVGVSADLSPVQIYAGVQHSVASSLALALSEDAEPSIEGPVVDEAPTAVASGLGNTSPLTTPDYPGVRLMPSPAFSSRRDTAIDRIVIHITSAPQSPYIGSHFARPDANSSAHYMVDQNGAIIQFVREEDKAWHAGTANRRSIGIEHVAVERGGARYGSTTFPYTPPTDAELTASAQLVAHLCSKYGLTPDRSTILGHREADPSTTHSSCPDGAWDWTDYMARVAAAYAALPATGVSAGPTATAQGLSEVSDTIEIKYRAFIPAPLILGPNSSYDLPWGIASGEDFGGDNRSFQYSGGTSRGEITALVDLAANNSLSNLRMVDRHWSESKAYDSTYTYHVEGKPDWWLDRQAGLTPSRHATLSADDDNLNIAIGGGSGIVGAAMQGMASGMGAGVLTVTLAGALPLVSPSPDIDAEVRIFVRRTANGMEAKITGSHDGFPAHELYVNGVQVHAYDPVAAGKSPTSLLPPMDIDIDTAWIRIPPRAAASAQGLAQVDQPLVQHRKSLSPAHALEAQSWTINWDEVERIPQPTDNGCWATAAAMVLGWRDRVSVSPALLAKCNAMDTSLQGGLSPSAKRAFIDAVGLVVHPNACYTADAFRDIIEANGPIWVTADVPGIHAIVATGMYSEGGQNYVRITDPWDRVVGSPGAPGSYAAGHATGSQYIMTYDAFTAEFEAAGTIDRIQLAHSGGTFGHTINRGNASGAGYALGLGDDTSSSASPPPSTKPTVRPADSTPSRAASSEGGRSYDLAQLSGMVRPSNALAGGAGMAPVAGERMVLDDWPYIEEEGQRSQANLAIDWKFDGAAVGEVVIAPTGGSVASGRTVAVKADILPGPSTPDRTVLLVRVTTTFAKAGEADQSAINEVTLSADGRASRTHGAPGDGTAAAPSSTTPPADQPVLQPQVNPQPQPVMA